MTIIRCPKCNRTENIQAWGKWNVCCPDCKTSFVVYISRKETAKDTTIICPRCKYQESVTIDSNITVKCPRCSLIFSG